MKRLIIAFLIPFTYGVSFGQNIPVDSLKIEINDGLNSQDVFIPVVEAFPKKQKLIDIKSDNWNNVTFNPYSFQKIEYPLQLNFTDSTYISPIHKPKVITSRYGWRRGRPHKGIDIDLVTGDSVVAVLDGVVRFSAYSRGHGKTVVVRHYNGLETAYAHLSKRLVKANDTIKKGEVLGLGGNSGHSSGSHLHFITSFKGQYIHPEYLFDFSENNKVRAKELWITKEWTGASYHSAYKKSRLKLFETEEEAIASLVKTKIVYVVRQGDTLSRISKRNRVSIAAICRSNSIKKSSKLRIGQRLILEL